jgi:hypothetical protein
MRRWPVKRPGAGQGGLSGSEGGIDRAEEDTDMLRVGRRRLELHAAR